MLWDRRWCGLTGSGSESGRGSVWRCWDEDWGSYSLCRWAADSSSLCWTFLQDSFHSRLDQQWWFQHHLKTGIHYMTKASYSSHCTVRRQPTQTVTGLQYVTNDKHRFNMWGKLIQQNLRCLLPYFGTVWIGLYTKHVPIIHYATVNSDCLISAHWLWYLATSVDCKLAKSVKFV